MKVVKQFFLFNLFLSSLIVPSFVIAEDMDGTPSLNIETYLDENSLNKEKSVTTKNVTNLKTDNKETVSSNSNSEAHKENATLKSIPDSIVTTDKSEIKETAQATDISDTTDNKTVAEKTSVSDKTESNKDSNNLNLNISDDADNTNVIDNKNDVSDTSEKLKESDLKKDNLDSEKSVVVTPLDVDKSKESIDANDASKNIANASSSDNSDKDIANSDTNNNNTQSINNPILSQVEKNSKVDVAPVKTEDTGSKGSNNVSVKANSNTDKGNGSITNTKANISVKAVNNDDISVNKEKSIETVANETLNDDSKNDVAHISEDLSDNTVLSDSEVDYLKIDSNELYTPSYLKNVYIPYFKSQYELPQVIDTNTKLLNIRSVSDESILMFDVGVSEDIGILNVDGVPTDNLILNRICGIVLAEKVLRNLSNVSVLFYHKDVQFYAKALTFKNCVIEPNNFDINAYLKGEKERIKSEFEYFIDLKNENKLSKPIVDTLFIPYALEFLSKELIDTNYKEIKFLKEKSYYNSLYDGNIELVQFIDDKSKDFLSLKTDKEFLNSKLNQLCFSPTFSQLLKKLRDFSYVYKDSKGNDVLQLVVNNLTCDFVTQPK
ncbi:MAG: hypothetical protein UHD07_04205 [Ruminobacter sp.]|nr:hypothetical protein [Ruminobacter sp.]